MSATPAKVPTFKPDFSPTVQWPIFFIQTPDDGPQEEVKIMMRWNRPSADDAKKYLAAKSESDQVPFNYLREYSQIVDDCIKTNQPIPPKKSDAQLEAMAAAVFDPDEELKRWWKFWKVDAIEGFNPENPDDVQRFLSLQGMREALISGMDALMAGGRQKNSQTPPGR